MKREDPQLSCIPERRLTDERLRKVEDTTTYIKAKLDNGLTERTKKTCEKLDKLVDKQTIFEQTMYGHLAKVNIASTKTDLHMTETNALLATIASTQAKWTKTFNAVVVGVVFFLLSSLGWVVYNSEDIGTIIHFLEYDILNRFPDSEEDGDL